MNPRTTLILRPLLHAINALRDRGRTTVPSTDIIRALNGTYLVDDGMTVGASPNARLGRFISRHSAALGIVQISTKRPAWDDRDPPRKTCYARYALNPGGSTGRLSGTTRDRPRAAGRAPAIP